MDDATLLVGVDCLDLVIGPGLVPDTDRRGEDTGDDPFKANVPSFGASFMTDGPYESGAGAREPGLAAPDATGPVPCAFGGTHSSLRASECSPFMFMTLSGTGSRARADQGPLRLVSIGSFWGPTATLPAERGASAGAMAVATAVPTMLIKSSSSKPA